MYLQSNFTILDFCWKKLWPDVVEDMNKRYKSFTQNEEVYKDLTKNQTQLLVEVVSNLSNIELESHQILSMKGYHINQEEKVNSQRKWLL